MGFSSDYSNVQAWKNLATGYQTGAMVKYDGNIFKADYWAQAEPGKKPKPEEGWALYDELYDITGYKSTSSSKNIIGYLPTWRKKDGFPYKNQLIYRSLTHVIISFIMFSSTSIGALDSKSVADVKAVLGDVYAAAEPLGVKVMVALGGATDYAFLNLMTDIGNNPSSNLLNIAANNVVNFLKSNQLHGIDLDLECWWDPSGDPSKDKGGRAKKDGPHPAGKGLTLFASKLRQMLPDAIISAAFPGTSWYGNNFDPSIEKYLNWIGLMTYDFTGSWNLSPVGPHSALFKIRNQSKYMLQQQGPWPQGMENNPIFTIEDSLWYWTNKYYSNWQGTGANIPRTKVAIGAAAYGYDFSYAKDADDLTKEVPPGYKTLPYRQIYSEYTSDVVNNKENIVRSGSRARPAFVKSAGNYPYAHNIYYDTAQSVSEKMKFTWTSGCQGVIIWEITGDIRGGSHSLLDALYSNARLPNRDINRASEKLYKDISELPIDNFVKKYPNAEWIMAASKEKNYYLVYASAGIKMEQNIFFQLRFDMRASVLKIFASKGAGIKEVLIDVLTARVSTYLGSYTGFEAYASLIDGSASFFDMRIGVGVAAGAGYKDDSIKVEAVELGFTMGRKMGISVLGQYFGIDIKKIFTEKQWQQVRPYVGMAINYFIPSFSLTKELATLVGNFFMSGRTIEISIMNLTLFDWKIHDSYFERGNYDSVPPSLDAGKNGSYKVTKDIGFYGVLGVTVYSVPTNQSLIAIYFANPIKGGNTINVGVFKKRDGLSAKSIYQRLEGSRIGAQTTGNIDADFFKGNFQISSGDTASAAVQVISSEYLE